MLYEVITGSNFIRDMLARHDDLTIVNLDALTYAGNRQSLADVEAARHFDAERVEIISGYRHPKYNLMLRKKGHQVAAGSYHTKAKAVDFRIPGSYNFV